MFQAAPSVSGQPTYYPQQTQGYQPPMPAQAPSYSNARTEQSPAANDAYLASVSKDSLEVLQHFGVEAPALLNKYACVVEDALIAQAQTTGKTAAALQQVNQALTDARAVIDAAAEDNAAYHLMLTNPHLLANYVEDFFGPNGPYPTETAQDRLAAEVAANEQRFVPPSTVTQTPQQAPAFQRPQMDMPQPGVQQSAGGDFWNQFSAIADRNPAAAWQILSQATPEMFRSKILVSEE